MNAEFLNDCPTVDDLLAILQGNAELPADDPLLVHLEKCPDCQAAMDELIGHVKIEQTLKAVRPTIDTLKDHFEKGHFAAIPVPERPTSATRVPGFHVMESIGRGGSGVVFKAIELETGDVVALKWLPFSSQGDFVSAGKELAAARLLDHPGIVKLARQIQWDGQTAIVMDWIDGCNLQEVLDTRKLSTAESVELAIRICEILESAHGKGLIHRDLKPSNILLAGGRLEDPRLADFGLAKFEGPQGRYSTATVGIGTPGYMPPELVSADFGPVCQATDIYSLGVILHELLTGELPFEGKTHFDSLRKTCDEPVRPLRRRSRDIPADLETICLKCLAKRQPDRYATANQLRLDLERFRDGKPILARRVSRIELVKHWARRNPAVALISSGSFCMLLVGVAMLAFLLERSRQSQAASEESLKLAVETMTNATPIFKRFTQITKPDEVELKKLRLTAEDCLKIGDDTRDFRVRCDSYFNALQMATAMRSQPDLLGFAESIARLTIEKFRNFKAENESALRAKNLKPKAPDPITALDLVNIRLGYSLIELAYINEAKGPAFAAEFETQLDHAIAQCETALKENSTLEEVHFMLGGFLHSKAEIFSKNDNLTQARAVMASSIQHHRLFYDFEPADISRNYSYLHALKSYLTLDYENAVASGFFGKSMGEILTDICALQILKPEGWQTLLIRRIEKFSDLIILDCDRTDPAAASVIIEELLDLIHDMADDENNDLVLGAYLFGSWTNLISQLCNRGQVDKARQECARLQTWLALFENNDKIDNLICFFRLFAPLPEFRSIEKARQIVEQAKKTAKSMPLRQAMVEILMGGPIEPERLNPEMKPYSKHYSNYCENEFLMLLHTDPADWPDLSVKRFAGIRQNAVRNPLLFDSIKLCLIQEIQARAEAAQRPIPQFEDVKPEPPVAASSARPPLAP